MRHKLFAGLLAAGFSLMLWPGQARAQGPCPEGKTFGGECVNPELAANMRQLAIIYSQPKLSLTAYPVLPSDDAQVRYPSQLNPDFTKPSPTGTPGG
jgi:hypothetical protein